MRTTDEKIQLAIDELEKISRDETNRYAYYHREKQLRDYINDIVCNRKEEREITQIETLNNAAKKLKEKNADYELISYTTGLTYEQIDAL